MFHLITFPLPACYPEIELVDGLIAVVTGLASSGSRSRLVARCRTVRAKAMKGQVISIISTSVIFLIDYCLRCRTGPPSRSYIWSTQLDYQYSYLSRLAKIMPNLRHKETVFDFVDNAFWCIRLLRLVSFSRTSMPTCFLSWGVSTQSAPSRAWLLVEMMNTPLAETQKGERRPREKECSTHW